MSLSLEIERIVDAFHYMMAIPKLPLFIIEKLIGLCQLEVQRSFLFFQSFDLFQLPCIFLDQLLKFLLVGIQFQGGPRRLDPFLQELDLLVFVEIDQLPNHLFKFDGKNFQYLLGVWTLLNDVFLEPFIAIRMSSHSSCPTHYKFALNRVSFLMQTDNSEGKVSPFNDSLFESQVKEMERTHKMLSTLQSKLNGFFKEKKQLESHNSLRQGSTKSNKSLPIQTLERLETKASEYKSKEINPERGYLLKQNVDINQMESYYKHKNQLIQNKIKQLEKDLEIDEQEKFVLYKKNQILEKSLKQLKSSKQTRRNSLKEEAPQNSDQINDLLHKLSVQKRKNHRLTKQVELLKENYITAKVSKTTQASISTSPDKKCRSIKTQLESLRSQIKKQKENQKQLKKQIVKNDQIKSISCELKKLKSLILAKSKLKIK